MTEVKSKSRLKRLVTQKTGGGFEFVEVGNTYSEYRCRACGQHIVLSDDCDHPCDPGHYHKCQK